METNNKLREACANIAEYARSAQCHTEDAHVLGYLNQIEGWAKAALAEPPRNCDIGSAEEQGERCLAQFNQWRHEGDGRKLITAIMEWAQMPYEEGGAK